MIDDADDMMKRAAYIDGLRLLYRRERLTGLVGCLVGTVLLVVARYRAGAPEWLFPVALAIIAASWVLFAFVIYQRTRYVRAHPYSPTRKPES